LLAIFDVILLFVIGFQLILHTLLHVSRTRTNFGDKAFSVVGPKTAICVILLIQTVFKNFLSGLGSGTRLSAIVCFTTPARNILTYLHPSGQKYATLQQKQTDIATKYL